MTVKLILVMKSLIFILFIAQASKPSDDVHLVTQGISYQASFTYTIHDIMNISYCVKSNFFKSENFSTESDKHVKWYFKVVFEEDWIYLNLVVASLPPNTAHLSGVSNCGFVVDNLYEQNIIKTANVGDNFSKFQFKRRDNLRNETLILPNGHLTFRCEVDAILVHNINATDWVIPTEILKKVTPLECRKNIVKDTLKLLRLHNGTLEKDVNLYFGPYSRTIFKLHGVIMASRMPQKLPETNSGDIYFNFKGELETEEELKDLINFMYWGTLDHPRKHCKGIYQVAYKYGFECLRNTCEAELEDI